MEPQKQFWELPLLDKIGLSVVGLLLALGLLSLESFTLLTIHTTFAEVYGWRTMSFIMMLDLVIIFHWIAYYFGSIGRK